MPHGNMINIRILPTDARNGLLQARREAIAIGFKFFPASNHLVLSVVVLPETSVAAVKEECSCSVLVLGSYQRLPIVINNEVRYYNLSISIVMLQTGFKWWMAEAQATLVGEFYENAAKMS